MIEETETHRVSAKIRSYFLLRSILIVKILYIFRRFLNINTYIFGQLINMDRSVVKSFKFHLLQLDMVS